MTPDLSALPALLERIKAATGPSFALEQEIERVLEPDRTEMGLLTLRYSASLDAALALVERVLPGWLYGVRETGVWAPHHRWAGKPVCQAELVDNGDSDSAEPFCDPADADEDDGVRTFGADHCSPALALLAALVAAEMENRNV